MDSIRVACAPRWQFMSLETTTQGPRFAFRWTDIDEAMQLLLHRDVDLAEISFATWLRLRSGGDRRIEAAPIFPLRAFRHGLISVSDSSGITSPSDLRGRRVAVGRYVSTALVHLRGVLARDYGVPWQEVTWIRTGKDADLWRIPDDVEIRDRPGSRPSDLVRDGTADAAIHFWGPEQDPRPLRRLFRDVRAVESDYYRRTGILPIMHVFAGGPDLEQRHPGAWAALRGLDDTAASVLRRFPSVVGLSPWAYLDYEWAARLIDGGNRWCAAPDDPAIGAAVRDLVDQRLIAADEAFDAFS